MWKVEISYQTPLEHYGCIVRQCDACYWKATRKVDKNTYETISRDLYLRTLVKFSGVKRRINAIKANWEKYAKENNITNWKYAN